MHRLIAVLRPLGATLIAAGALVVACDSGDDSHPAGTTASGTSPGGSGGSGGTAAGQTTGGSSQGGTGHGGNIGGGGGGSSCDPPAGLGRAQQWIRGNPMFISALNVTMGVPSAAVVNEYYDGFHANAAHLWEDGLPTEMNGWAAAGHPEFRFLAWVHKSGISQDNQQIIGGIAADHPARVGYQIGDEPANMADLLEIEAGAEAVRAADPDALLVLNFSTTQPSDIQALLDYAGANVDVDVFAYDLYTYTQGAYEALSLIRNAALQYDKAYWRYLKSYANPNNLDWPSASDMRWDAFVGLVFGYTGHSWFLYQVTHPGLAPAFFESIVGGYEAPKTARWSIAADLNVELAQYGRAFSLLRSTDVRYRAMGAATQPPETIDWAPGAGGDPFLTDVAPQGQFQEALVGSFVDDCDDHYVALQNPNHSHGNFPTILDSPATFVLTFDFAGADPSVDPTQVETLDVATGTVQTLALDTAGPSPQLSVTLPPGDMILFKYRTDHPFALQ